eukprot:5062773-Prymnesium_polylepis.1
MAFWSCLAVQVAPACACDYEGTGRNAPRYPHMRSAGHELLHCVGRCIRRFEVTEPSILVQWY